MGKRVLPKREIEYDVKAMEEAWGGAGVLYTSDCVNQKYGQMRWKGSGDLNILSIPRIMSTWHLPR